MKTYELADLLAVIDTDVQDNVRAIPFSGGAFLLHHSGIWLWLDETKKPTNEDKKDLFTALGLPDVTSAATSIDDKTVWGIGPDKPLMPMPFTLSQLNEFDTAGAITEVIKPLNDEEFSAALIGVNASEVARFLQFREVPADKAVRTQTASHAPEAGEPKKPHLNKTEKTRIFEAKVLELMDKFWNDRKPGTEPTKSELHKLVYDEILRTPVRGPRKTTLSMVKDAAKPWKMPIVLPAMVPDSKFNDKRHPFKDKK